MDDYYTDDWQELAQYQPTPEELFEKFCNDMVEVESMSFEVVEPVVYH